MVSHNAREGIERSRKHIGQASRRLWCGDEYSHDIIGCAGERAFAERYGVRRVKVEGSGGDPGYDFFPEDTGGFTVDIKTTPTKANLQVPVGEVTADIYVMGLYSKETDSVEVLGWYHGSLVKGLPSRDFGVGVQTHYIWHTKLKPMRELELWLWPTHSC